MFIQFQLSLSLVILCPILKENVLTKPKENSLFVYLYKDKGENNQNLTSPFIFRLAVESHYFYGHT